VNKIRNEFSIKSDVRLVGTIGRLVWQKGLGYFLQAVKEIETRSNIKNAKYLIVGEGKDHDNLEQKAKELGIRDKVIFTGFRQDIKEILCALDILILPSIREGQPIILLEAMAMGKPVIATDIQGVNETVLNGITGMLVPAKSYLALAKAIINLLKDNKKAQEMGEMGRKLVEEKFNLKDKIKQHEQLYQAVIAERAEALTKIN
jgi:glycosyltransferase involved in cell wall biosynthesis